MTIASRLTVLFIGLVLALAVVAVGVTASREYQLVLERVVAASEARLLSRPDLQVAIYNRDPVALQRILGVFLEIPEVSLAVARDGLGEALARRTRDPGASERLPAFMRLRQGVPVTDTGLLGFDARLEPTGTGLWAAYRNQAWYNEQVREAEEIAAKYGFSKVSQLKLAVTTRIRDFVAGGGFLFAMCSATDSYDIALAAEGVDIAESMFDGDGMDPQAQQKLDFSKTFAFEDFTIVRNPYEYAISNIDVSKTRNVPKELDFFTLFEFSAKWDPVPTMLTQCHTRTIPGFYGQTTAYRKDLVKSNVLILGENKPANEARYIHGEYGYGTWTFYGGHDPEDYKHYVGDPPTELALHPNSPGYRLILNNILFPAAKKKKQKT